MMLSPHFSLEEMTRSRRARILGIKNDPPPFIVDALTALCVHVLEPIRAVVGPLVVNSGYRSPMLNDATPGSSERSQHLKGEAADIECPRMSNADLGAAIERLMRTEMLPIDQLIYEGVRDGDPRAGWIHASHVSYPGRNRGLVQRIQNPKTR
jgi:zinc D-Ala-D-Ala carboxypeptidase